MARQLTEEAKAALEPTMERYAPSGYDPASDDMTIPFAIELVEKDAEIRVLRDFVDWVETWTSSPIGSFSVSGLDGLFGMTRDKIAYIRSLKKP